MTKPGTAASDAGSAETDPYATYLNALVQAGLLIPSGVPGVYSRSGVFEDVLLRFDRYVTQVGRNDGASVMRPHSILPREQFVKSGYLKSFPNLIGSVSSFMGN